MRDDRRKAMFARLFSLENAPILEGKKRENVAMLAKLETDEDAIKKIAMDENWIACEKYDGIRAMTVADKDKEPIIFNPRRGGDDIAWKFPELTDDIKRAIYEHVPVIIEGEINYRKDDTDEFHPVMARLNTEDRDKIIADSKENPMEYRIFDVLEYEGEDTKGLPLRERRKILNDMIGAGIGNVLPEECVAENKMDYANEEIKKEKEGVVFKDLDSKYESGKRTGSWVKYKRPEEETFVAYGMERGSGKNEDRLGSVLIGKYKDDKLIEAGKVGSGFSDEERRHIWQKYGGDKEQTVGFDDKDKFGIEVKYMETDSHGGLRHPVVERIREDLSKEDLIM
jgi:bifunctional non-homologous end joining protein LigD